MNTIEFLDCPPAGWFVLDVMRHQQRGRSWCALMIDVPLDDLKNSRVDFPARLYVHPAEYQPGNRTARQCWLSIPGKHKNKDAAWDALEEIMATRH